MGEQVENHKDERVPLARRENFVDLFQTKSFVAHFWEQRIFVTFFGTPVVKTDRRAKIPSEQNLLDHLRTKETPKFQN